MVPLKHKEEHQVYYKIWHFKLLFQFQMRFEVAVLLRGQHDVVNLRVEVLPNLDENLLSYYDVDSHRVRKST